MKMQSQPETQTKARNPVLARFMLGFDGDSLPAQLAQYLAQGLAGVVIYQRNYGNVESLRNLTAEILRAAGRPVLIGIDQEGGTRFALKSPFTAWPSAAELGAADDLKYVEQVAHAMAVELRAVGCNLNFAPMLDLHVNPESPVTKNRSFGSDPRRVAEMGVAFDRGLRAGGVLSCAKHFPGHGDAIVDPHSDLPVYMGTMEELDAAELVPFASAAHAGVPLIMTAHILLPRIDPENPASLSRPILVDVLRRRMHFDGVILADDLGMGAIAKRHGSGAAAVQTLRAGTDVAMLCHDWAAVEPAIEAVQKARAEGHFAEAEWNASLHRIERVLAASEIAPATATGLHPPLEIIGCKEHLALAAKIRSFLG
jgi:beta-N-acetylhexosaminidase